MLYVFPREKIAEILRETGRASVRQRALPAHLMIYLIVALALYMNSSAREVLRCLLEGLQWLSKTGKRLTVAGDAGISRVWQRLGYEPLERFHEEVAGPVAQANTRGAWYRQWRTVRIDGSTLDVADTPGNEDKCKRPKASWGRSAYPKVRVVSLVEGGTHVRFGTRMGKYTDSELSLARKVVGNLSVCMLCIEDRNFFGYKMWNLARSTGAEIVWRIKKNLAFPRERELPDGSYLSRAWASHLDRRHGRWGVTVRVVVEYRLEGVEGAEPLYRLVTTVLDPQQAPARELAALYHERREIETTFDELKTHLRGRQIVLRSRTPDLMWQEFYGLLLAHYAVRKLMHRAAPRADLDPDRLSFMHAVRVVRCELPIYAATPPLGKQCV